MPCRGGAWLETGQPADMPTLFLVLNIEKEGTCSHLSDCLPAWLLISSTSDSVLPKKRGRKSCRPTYF